MQQFWHGLAVNPTPAAAICKTLKSTEIHPQISALRHKSHWMWQGLLFNQLIYYPITFIRLWIWKRHTGFCCGLAARPTLGPHPLSNITTNLKAWGTLFAKYIWANTITIVLRSIFHVDANGCLRKEQSLGKVTFLDCNSQNTGGYWQLKKTNSPSSVKGKMLSVWI